MIDIHTHILPGVDDGSKNLNMSLEMVRISHEQGVDTIVVTPHCMPGTYGNIANESLEKKWHKLYEAVKESKLPVHMRKGMEVLISEKSMKLIREKRVWTINGSDYLLVEFAFDEDPLWCTEKLKEITRLGYTPVIAHPERYYFVQSYPQIVYDWYLEGYGIQVNKESILSLHGKKEKETVTRLLRHSVVSCVASDTHRPDILTPGLRDVHDYLEKRYGKEYTHMLVTSNPLRIVNNKTMVGYRPVSFENEE